MVTNGSMEAAALLFRYMIEPGDRVIVEQPSYDRTLLLLGRTGAELVPVPLEADGIDVDAFEAALADGPVKLAHVIPNFHNPAGCTLSAAKRERLVELAAEHGFWIFEDDPYRLVRFGDGELPPTMLSQDSSERVIHASSFSKTVSPGVRVGYLAGPPEPIGTLAKRGSVPALVICSIDIEVFVVIQPPPGIGSRPITPSERTMAQTVTGEPFVQLAAVTLM